MAVVNTGTTANATYSFLNNALALDIQQARETIKGEILKEDPSLTEQALEDEITRRLFASTLNDKINSLVSDKTAALNSLMNDYSQILQQDKLNKDAFSAFSLFGNQQNTMAGDNINRLKLLRESIYTLRKDAQNADEEYKKYNSLVYFLKVSFVSLLIITIIFVVSRSGYISNDIRNYASMGVLVIGFMYISYDLWYNIGRDRVNYDTRNWPRNF